MVFFDVSFYDNLNIPKKGLTIFHDIETAEDWAKKYKSKVECIKKR